MYVSPNQDHRSLEEIVTAFFGGRKDIKILEAGCGSMSHFPHDQHARIVGVDISQEQLEKNTYLHEKILGDIQNERTLPESAFDLIICWDVLEHLPSPERALRNFARAVKDGGLILLASPNVMTLRGLITKFSPHWFHVLYAKHVAGVKEAGLPGTYPFKSYHRFTMAPGSILKFAKKNDLSVVLFRYSFWEQPEYQFKTFRLIWDAANMLTNMVTFGKIGTDRKKGFQVILKKNGSSLPAS